MPKTNCNIIKDLLPSYLDEICSAESQQLVEEHFNECEACKKIYKKTKLEVLNTNASNSKEIDYLKTIKTNVKKKNTALLIVAGILFFIQLYLNFAPYRFDSNLTMYANYIFPILIAGTLFAILPDYTEHTVPNKIKMPILGIEFAAMTYIFVLMTLVAYNLLHNVLPFGIKAEYIGPFLGVQTLALAILFIIAFVTTLIISLRKRAICPALCIVPLFGLSLMFMYINRLHEFTTRISLLFFIQPYIVIVCEIVVLVGIYMFINRKKVV